jgi:hypothetical protein
MIKELVQILPEAIMIAVNPVAICAAILLLLNQPGRHKAVAYLSGWVLGLILLVCGVYLLAQTGAVAQTDSQQDPIRWLIWMGILFIVMAIYEMTQIRLKKPDEPPRLKWLGKLDIFSPLQVFGVGMVIAGLNIKNAGLVFSALISVQSFKLQGNPIGIILFVFIMMGSIAIAAPVAYRYIKGAEAENRLKEWLQWLLTNSALVLSILFLFLGIKWIGAGLP